MDSIGPLINIQLYWQQLIGKRRVGTERKERDE